ncbi:hypothetical protein [Nocardia asiatica]|uniref:hypothetical protein n=1 Tax=Nocardia asiatica TaxID=209252 RepID=UPI0002FE37D1|nr:hypothetical protein [Nocardia asiatica]
MSNELDALAELLGGLLVSQQQNQDWFPPNGGGQALCLDGWFDVKALAAAVLNAGLRSPARRIETAEELDALPVDTVIRWADTVEQHIGSGWWITPGTDDHSHSEQIIDVADGNEIVVLWTPEYGDTE